MGFSFITGQETVVHADNASFDGTERAGRLLLDGQLWIGSTALPHVVKNNLTSGTGITITNGPGSITVATNGSVVGQTITGNTGGALSPTGGNWNIIGATLSAGTNAAVTSGSGSTLTVTAINTAKWIVDPTADRGTHQTITAAMAAASSGETIFVRPGTYTENFTWTAGVDICAFECDAQTPNVTIVGKITATSAGIRTMSGIRLQTNSDNFLVISGSAATIVNLYNCYLNCSNATGITLSSSGGAILSMFYCQGDLGTTGIKLFDLSNAGSGFNLYYTKILNSGGSSTASTASAGTFMVQYSELYFPITTSGTTAGFTILYSTIQTSGQNATSLTHGSTSGTNSTIRNSFVSSGSASAISVGASATLDCQNNIITSSNTNAITGSGTLNFGMAEFAGSSSVINTTTQSGLYSNIGKYKATQQPMFSAYQAAASTDATGDGTVVILGAVTVMTELYDIGSNFTVGDGAGAAATFTAPVTGYYHFDYGVLGQQGVATMTAELVLTIAGTSAGVYTFGNYGTIGTGNWPMAASRTVFMTAADTAVVKVNFGNGTKTVDIYGGASDPRTYFSGQLIG